MTAICSSTQVVPAVAMSRRAANTVAAAGAGRVHSVFRRCFNIKKTNGEWLTVAITPFPQTPDAIIIESRDDGLGVKQDMAVEIFPNEIFIPSANLSIVFSKTKIFDTRRTPFVHSDENRERSTNNLLHALEIIRLNGRICDVPEFQRHADAALSILRKSILTNDTAAVRAQCERLLGLGIGLTPSGDDILGGIATGLFLGDAANDGGGKYFLSVLCELVCEGARTTDLSARSLQLCVECEINDIVYEAARAILCEDQSETEQAISVLLTQGGTSGTETAQGLCLGLQIAEEFFKNQNQKTTPEKLC